MKRSTACLASIALWLAACAAHNDHESVVSDEMGLRNATPVACSDLVANGKPAFLSGIGELYSVDFCTATLVRKNVIITAAHCVVPGGGRAGVSNPSADPLPAISPFGGKRKFIMNPANECPGPQAEVDLIRYIAFGSGYEDVAIAELHDDVKAKFPAVQVFGVNPSRPNDGALVKLYGRGTNDSGVLDQHLRFARIRYRSSGEGTFKTSSGYDGTYKWSEGGVVYEENLWNHGGDEIGHLAGGDSGGPLMWWDNVRLINRSCTTNDPNNSHCGAVQSGFYAFIYDYFSDIRYIDNVIRAMGNVNNKPAFQAGINGLLDAVSADGHGAVEDFLAVQASVPEGHWNPAGKTASGEGQCGCTTGIDNFCSHPPSTPGCLMTAPGGYCDPNGDGSYTDGDWVRGYDEYQAACGTGGDPAPDPGAGGSSGTGGGGTCACGTGIDNFCSLPPSTPSCPMTAPGGYCDPNGDGSYADGDWVQGYDNYQAACGGSSSSGGGQQPPVGSCPCISGTDNFCAYAPNTPNCPMTAPGGYCDPNGDGDYTDADWVRGYDEHHAACGF